MINIIKYNLHDIFRNRVVISYTVFLFLVSVSFFNLDENPVKGVMSLLNIVLIVLPMVSIIFSTIHQYNSSEFTELLLAQPIKRKTIIISQFLSLSISMCTAVIIGIGIPVLMYYPSEAGIMLVLSAVLLTLVFISFAVLTSVIARDKSRGIGMSILLWFFFALIYDGLLLWIVFSFSDYPLEQPILILTALNPVDLARILVLLKLDLSALMGYTGALYRKFFGSDTGMILSAIILMLWVIIPVFFATRTFIKKDL
ncbi:MAG: ABC transporter permease subunit [Chitinophagales bacterium]|nr:ABC transporter permease subunit [Bacteroidota bacterium]MBP7399912.1 ABC transporter permease subunit [Chitinophagales bacterium]MBK8486827.1 ABC transporter permease subunit [Bacteroidota bacterium]MBP8755311.1 ABC transporter permease subunit [Chitinophagales bacterium]MBP9190535.1 ABC transporter permease subunit [Chitinophagales bacterium]